MTSLVSSNFTYDRRTVSCVSFEHICVIFITLIMVRLLFPPLVSVKEIQTLEYHNYIEIISGVPYVYEA
jgi:hypothetical protein